MNKDEALRLALEALEYPGPSWIEARQPAITAIKQALAQPEPEPEPVAWLYESVCGNDFATRCEPPSYAKNIRPLYTFPPKREWQGLTDDEKSEIYHNQKFVVGFYSPAKFADAIEAKLKERNT